MLPEQKLPRQIDTLRQGDHIILFYSSSEELLVSVMPFIKDGLDHGERVVYISEPEGRGQVLEKLKRFNIEKYIQKGSFKFSDPEKDIREALRKTGLLIEESLSSGYTGLRIAIDVYSVYKDMSPSEILRFETRLDEFYAQSRCIALCLFDTRKFTPELLLSIFVSHPIVMIGTEIHENISYPPPREMLDKVRADVLPKYIAQVLVARKALEDKLEQERNLWRKYLDIADVIMVVIGRDERIQLMNRKGCDLTGYDENELIGKNWFDTFIPSDRRDEVRTAFRRMVKGDIEPLEYFENPIITRSGEPRIISWHNAVLRNEKGEITGTLSSGEDITRRREAEEHYRDIFENAEEGIFQITVDGKLIHVNPSYARMLGYASPEDLMKSVKNITEHYPNPEKRKVMIERIKKYGKIKGYEVQLRRLDGQKIWISASARMVRDSKGIYLEGMVEDITKRKQAEKDLRNTMQRLRGAMEGAIHAVAMTVEAKDPYTAGHQQHVAELSREIARHMGLPKGEVEGIYLSGMIHDLGKISVPTEFLAKPGKLTDFEYSLIKTHAEAGYRILKDIDFPWPVAEIIYQHHERLDGSGYPRGLKSDQILRETKIISVADVVEAMTFHRPYRPGFGLKLAMEEIRSNKERLYESEVVDTCLAIFDKGEFVWDEVLKST
jgi:PAS domain S-box-containing protein